MGRLLKEEMKFMNYKDNIKIVADGPKIGRETVFNSVSSEGFSIKVIISGPKNTHPLGDFTPANLFEVGLFDITISGPKEKQVEITDFAEDKD